MLEFFGMVVSENENLSLQQEGVLICASAHAAGCIRWCVRKPTDKASPALACSSRSTFCLRGEPDMHDIYRKNRVACRPLGMALLVLGSLAAQASNAQEMHQRQRIYQQDRQVCLSGQSNQSQKTCLREAGAAMHQNMGAQSQASAEQMAANALRRCDAFTGDARQTCVARMEGHGSVQGSVAAGGILRELSEPVQ
jgi:hypothetical protein